MLINFYECVIKNARASIKNVKIYCTMHDDYYYNTAAQHKHTRGEHSLKEKFVVWEKTKEIIDVRIQ